MHSMISPTILNGICKNNARTIKTILGFNSQMSGKAYPQSRLRPLPIILVSSVSKRKKKKKSAYYFRIHIQGVWVGQCRIARTPPINSFEKKNSFFQVIVNVYQAGRVPFESKSNSKPVAAISENLFQRRAPFFSEQNK